MDIHPDHLSLVKKILKVHVPQYDVWAFGSRVNLNAKKTSDLDININDIEIKNNIIFLNSSPAVLNKIFIKKKEIISLISNELTIKIVDIKRN